MSLGAKIKDLVISKRFLINLLLLIGIYILVVFGLKIYLSSYTDHGQKITVPDLANKTENQAKAIVEPLGLSIEISESVYDPKKPDGTIISQDPLPSDKSKVYVKTGRIIRVKVTKNTQMVEVPNCIDKSERFAENILKSRGFKYKIEYQPSVESAGAVIKQLYNGKPVTEKQKIAIGSTITIVVGTKMTESTEEIPNLVGLTICDVKSRLQYIPNTGLAIICEGCTTAADTCNARVYSQSPEYIEGTTMLGGTTITVHATKQ